MPSFAIRENEKRKRQDESFATTFEYRFEGLVYPDIPGRGARYDHAKSMDRGIHFYLATLLICRMASCRCQLKQTLGETKQDTARSVMAGGLALAVDMRDLFPALPQA